ncbi:thiol reductant ABC exporter subunit CydD [Halobacillus salinus]|uniref:thiol reductant ABC exporter subunit CydD n=1 Tax=Halobacillus salinus TaxID=192814 RepID=UPI0009A8E3E0|nr:thiol reductant ABC exporter subunit CydD [Halobacillus salinus]
MGRDLLTYDGIKRILGLLIGITVIQAAAIVMQAVLLAEVVTHLFQGGAFSEVYAETVLFGGFFLLRHAMHHVKQRAAYRYSEKIGTDLRRLVLDRLFQQGPRVARKVGTGNVVTMLIEGVSEFKQYLLLFLPKMADMLVIPALVAVYVLSEDLTSAVILIATVPILVVFMILLGLAAQKKADRQWGMYRVLSNHFVDSLRGIETLKFLGLSKTHAKQIEGVSERYRKSTMGTLKMAFLSSFAMDFFTMLSVATVAVFLGLRLVEGEMMLQPALAILILAPEYFLPIRSIGSDYHATLNGQEAGRKLREIVAIPAFEVEAKHPVGTWTSECRLRLEQVSIQHEEGDAPSLDRVELEARGFQKIGIVGESGAGKSTLIDLLGGFLQSSSGSINVNGEAYKHLQRQDWQNQVSYIPQHPHLFEGSLYENIVFYRPDATKEEAEWAAARAGLLDLLRELPDGLEERIGQGGRSLSGGEAQRVALARAFLVQRPILLLDEPTAHLDVETEYQVKARMNDLFRGKLVFLATHRLHWMLDMDYIYFIKEGRVAEQGTHKELMDRRGHYYEMVEAARRGEYA